MTDSIRPINNNKDIIDGLRRFQEDFNRDFCLRDIKQDLIVGILSKNEFLEINQLSLDEQIDRLFFTFIYIKKDVGALVSLLRRPYPWLHHRILTCKDDKWITDYRKAIQDIPKYTDWNVHRVEYLWKIQQNLKKLQRNDEKLQYLILFGKLGFGKKWLAS